jgi:hypothetical protein
MSFNVSAYDEETITEKTDRLANGLNAYIKETQQELSTAGIDLIKEHQDESKEFVNKYNTYTASLVERTSKPISLSGDSDCLANLRLIDLDIIPVDPMDLLKPLKLKLKDLIEKSPCEMLTDELNDQIDDIDFAADSPFGTIGVRGNPEQKKADEELRRQKTLERKARVKNLVFDMGSDFKLKVTERRNVIFTENGAVIDTDEEYKVKTTKSIPKTQDLINQEGLLNVFEVFGELLDSDNNESDKNNDGDN